MKKIMFLLLIMPTIVMAQKKELSVGQNAHYEVKVYTSLGNFEVELFNDTPIHRDNFVKLANDNFYNNIIFHRIIKDFMIQAGDPASKSASAIARYGSSDVGYNIPAEIVNTHFHQKGALAAAREPDETNPNRESSGSQFYVVTGKVFNDSTMTKVKEILAKNGTREISQQKEQAYRTVGGAPHLDGSYTIFGQVIAGMKTIEKISQVRTSKMDRPIEDIFIIKIEVKKVEDR